MKLEDISLRDMVWILSCIDNGMYDGLVESIDKHDLDVLETLIDAVAATPHNGDDYYLGSYKEDIAKYRKELKEWEEEKASWQD